MIESDLNKLIFLLYKRKKYDNNEIVYLSKLSLINIKYILDAYYTFINNKRLTNISYKKQNEIKHIVLEDTSLSELDLNLWKENEKIFLDKYLLDYEPNSKYLQELEYLISYLLKSRPWELNSLILHTLNAVNNTNNITDEDISNDGGILYLSYVKKYNLYNS